MKFRYAIAGAVLAAAALAACGSSPALRYYALDAVTPVGSATHPALSAPIRVRHISLPHEMDHLGLTHRLGATQFAISDTDQWSAPLATLIQETMTRDLGERLGYDQVVAPDALPVAPHATAEQPAVRVPVQATLDLDFVSLSADDSCGITAQVNWTLSVSTGVARHGTATLAAPATSCPGGLPAALSAALGNLADQLIQPLSSF
jgi:uncharacterized lipoprotein YmbA